MEQNLYSVRIERHYLGGILKFPGVFAETDSYISELDFYNNLHQTIFCVARNSYLKQESLDKVIIAQKIKNLNISFADDVDVFAYIENLYFTQITQEGTLKASKELSFLRIKRSIFETALKIQSKVKESTETNVDALVSECDKLYHNTINNISLGAEPEDLFHQMPEIIDERGRNPVSEMGLITPHKDFNRLFGGIRKQGVYAFVSRPSHGKSTILADMAFRICLINQGCRALFLDTELEAVDVKFRLASSLTGISTWALETGNFVKNKQYCENLEQKREEFKKCRNLIDHLVVSGKPISEVESIIRRWFYKKIGRGNLGVVVYDYLKLTGEANSNKPEYILIGEKINSLKELSLSLNIPILTACQLNRFAESGTDDSSAISQSDRLQWLANFVAIFRRKTVDEILDDGPEFGSHKLIPLKTRFQGKDATGHSDLIRVQNGHGKYKYVPNFLNYDVNNFRVEEKGSLRDIIRKQSNIHHIQDPNDSDGQLI